MRKITLLISVLLLMTWVVKAETLNNPLDTNGKMIFVWDCATDQFAASNDFEIDQTITFAVDVTGTSLEDWLKNSPVGETRSIGFDFWTQWDEGAGACDGRFAKIKGNIYGATLNFTQFITSRQQQLIMLEKGDESAFTVGTITELYSNIFGFGYLNDGTNWGAEWWQLPMDVAVSTSTVAYTGTKTAAETIYKDETDETNFFPGAFTDWNGYAAPCVLSSAIENPTVSNSPIVKYEYFNLLGDKFLKQPESGIFIEKALKADGSSVTTKVSKPYKVVK